MVKYVIALQYDLDTLASTKTDIADMRCFVDYCMLAHGFDKVKTDTFISQTSGINQVNAVLAMQDIKENVPVFPSVLKEAKLMRVTDIDDLLQVFA